MNQDTIRRTQIWSGLLRLSHWGLAFSSLILISTGWLVNHSPSVATAASDYHYIGGAAFSLALILRLYLLFFDKLAGRWQFLSPANISGTKIIEMTKFYLSFGKAPLPRWYAHNPLWIPLYAFLFLCMVLTSLSGHFMEQHPIVLGMYLPHLHSVVTTIISLFTAVHILAVFMHDTKGDASDTSAMINGHRIFVAKPIPENDLPGVHTFNIKDLTKKPPMP